MKNPTPAGNRSDSNRSRRSFLRLTLTGAGTALAAGGFSGWASPAHLVKDDLMDRLLAAGVREASVAIGIDFDRVFAPLAQKTGHPYAGYRWSVSYSAGGGPLIQALPPEEEMGWAPWEEWFSRDGAPVRRAMVLYPVRHMVRNVPQWWILEESRTDMKPRLMEPAATLEQLFERNRIFEAAVAVGFDARKTILDPMTPGARAIYLAMRWSTAPHRLAADLPVIQCLPPAGRSGQWPWETWYTDGKTPLIHHVHYTVQNARTGKETWHERKEAPQRPAELFGSDWYYYNDKSMTPALAKTGR